MVTTCAPGGVSGPRQDVHLRENLARGVVIERREGEGRARDAAGGELRRTALEGVEERQLDVGARALPKNASIEPSRGMMIGAICEPEMPPWAMKTAESRTESDVSAMAMRMWFVVPGSTTATASSGDV